VSLPLETEQGSIRVLFIYFGGVLSGALGASIIEPTLMVGASAGVYCLLTSHISNIVIVSKLTPCNSSKINYILFYFHRTFHHSLIHIFVVSLLPHCRSVTWSTPFGIA
jgi:hypothetical protein